MDRIACPGANLRQIACDNGGPERECLDDRKPEAFGERRKGKRRCVPDESDRLGSAEVAVHDDSARCCRSGHPLAEVGFRRVGATADEWAATDEMESEVGLVSRELLEALDQRDEVLAGIERADRDEVRISVGQRVAPGGVGVGVTELAATETHHSRLELEVTLDFLRVVLARGEHQRSSASQGKKGGSLDRTLRARPEARMCQRQRVMHQDCVLRPSCATHEPKWDVGVEENNSLDRPPAPPQLSHVERQQKALVYEASGARSSYLHSACRGFVAPAHTGPAGDEDSSFRAHLARKAVDHRPDAACMLRSGCVDERSHREDCGASACPRNSPGGGA